jgi:ABC-2 type transport system permease protein
VLAIGILEKLFFGTYHFAEMLMSRLSGPEAYSLERSSGDPMHSMTTLSLGRFLSSPGLWIGLIVAAAFFAAAVRLRHSQGPI